MNLYEIKDVNTGQVIASAILAGEAAKLLDCSTTAVVGAYCGDYALQRKYKVEQIDTTIPRKDPLWIEWEMRRSWLLKLCRRA